MKQTLRAVLMSACLLLAGCEGRETAPMAQDVSASASSAEASATAGWRERAGKPRAARRFFGAGGIGSAAL